MTKIEKKNKLYTKTLIKLSIPLLEKKDQQQRVFYFLITLLFATASYFNAKLYVFDGVSYVDNGQTRHLNNEESLYFFIKDFANF